MSTDTQLTLTAKLLALVAPFMAKSDIRYYLNAINVRPAVGGGAIIVATDGHAIAYVLDREAKCDRELTIKVDGRALQACAVKSRINRQLVLRNGRVAIVEHETSKDEIYIQPGDPIIEFVAPHRYPDVFRLIPDPMSLVPGMAGSFNQFILRKMDVAATAVSKFTMGGRYGDYSPMTFWTKDGDRNSACVVRLDRFPDFFALLMPINSDLIKEPTPPFVVEAKKAHEKEQAKRKNPGAAQKELPEKTTP